MNYVIDETGWTREYVAWKINYPWLITWLDYRKKIPSINKNTFEISSMLKNLLGAKDTDQISHEKFKADDCEMFNSAPTLTREQAQSKLKGMGISPLLVNNLLNPIKAKG